MGIKSLGIVSDSMADMIGVGLGHIQNNEGTADPSAYHKTFEKAISQY